MRIALISDIHGNLESTEAVLRDIEKQGAEKIHFLGDVVGYGCNPNECIKLVNQHCEIKLLGNHDYAAMGLESTESFNQFARASMQWTQSKLKENSISLLADFEMQAVFLDYFLVHSSPCDPEAWLYILSLNQAARHFECFTQSVCFVGHSHLPSMFVLDQDGSLCQSTKASFNLQEGRRYIINIGSVGQPRDNDPRACYLIADTDSNLMEYRRVDYDIKKAQQKMKRAKLPDFLIERLAIGV